MYLLKWHFSVKWYFRPRSSLLRKSFQTIISRSVLRRPLLAQFDSTGRNNCGLSILLFSSSANPLWVTLARSGFSIMIFNTPTLDIRQRYFLKRLSTRKNRFRLSPQRSRLQFVESSGLNVETSPTILVDGRRWDAPLSRNLPGPPCASSLSAEHHWFILDPKDRVNLCSCGRKISCAVWIATYVFSVLDFREATGHLPAVWWTAALSALRTCTFVDDLSDGAY